MDKNQAVITSKHLEDFVSNNTLRFFSITGFSADFLQQDVAKWDTDDTFLSAKEIVKGMRVVNDTAEHGVALISEYNKLHTNDEEQKQYLLLWACYHLS